MAQYAFYFDQSRCTGCQTCEAACKTWNGVAAGPERWLRLFQWEKGTFPGVRVSTLFAPCYHCANPVCVDAAAGGMFKEPKYGAVLIDPLKATSLRAAAAACPWGAIVFESDAYDAKASMCTMCVDRLEQSLLPMCVASCQMRALDFGTLDSLKAKYPTAVTTLEDMPDAAGTNPSIIFKAHDGKKQVVPYDSAKALQLMGARPSGLPPVYTATTAVTDTTGLMNKDKLKMKVSTNAELLLRVKDDQS